jgi:hypothetical protein
MSMKNSNDTTGNRTRDFPDCSAVSQPTAPLNSIDFNVSISMVFCLQRFERYTSFFHKKSRQISGPKLVFVLLIGLIKTN